MLAEPATTTNTHLDAALAYHARGWYVVPACWTDEDGRCACPGRHTRERSFGKAPWMAGYERLRATEADIRRWWTDWPEANVAVLLGPSKLVDIAPDSPAAWRTFQERGLPRTAHAASGGGDGHLHYFYHRPDACPTHRICRPDQYDLLTEGVAILPPSRHRSGRRYQWITTPDELPRLPVVPLWAVDLLRSAVSTADRSGPVEGTSTWVPAGSGADVDPPVPLEGLGLARWRGELVTAHPDGTVDRSISLFEIGRALAHAGAEAPDIVAALSERDDTLGWGKYATRRDRATRYGEMAIKATEEVATFDLVAPSRNGHATVRTVDPATGEVLSEPAPSPWQSLSELVSTAPETQRQLVEGLFWRGRTHWLYSAPGVGKTLFSLAAWMHVAAGRPFCGREVEQGAVLLIEEDSPQAVIAEYAQLLADIYEFDLDALPFWLNRVQGLRLTDQESLERVWNDVLRAPEPPVLLGIDACERIVPSEKFSSKELDPLAQLLQRSMNAGITPAVIDHTRKAGTNPNTAPSDPLDMLYGGRSKSAISDVMLYFSGSIRSSARLAFTKFRGPLPAAADISFDAAEGFNLRAQPRQLTEYERRVINVLNNAFGGSVPRAALLEAIGASPRTGARVLASMVSSGLIVAEGSTKQGVRYRLNHGAPGVFS